MNGIDDCVTSWKKSDTFKLWDGVKNSSNRFVVHYKAEKPCNQCEKTFMKFAKYVGCNPNRYRAKWNTQNT